MVGTQLKHNVSKHSSLILFSILDPQPDPGTQRWQGSSAVGTDASRHGETKPQNLWQKPPAVSWQ